MLASAMLTGMRQLHWAHHAADAGVGAEGAHLHDSGWSYLDGRPEPAQHRLFLGEREQGRQGRALSRFQALFGLFLLAVLETD